MKANPRFNMEMEEISFRKGILLRERLMDEAIFLGFYLLEL